MQLDQLKGTIRQVPDFPQQGINFYDVSTLFRHRGAFNAAVRQLCEPYRNSAVGIIAGIEARGFVLGSAMAYELGLGLVLIRKFGKLPGETEGEAYNLEYGEAHIEVHKDAFADGEQVLIVDDLLATGGTARAAGHLVERLGARLAGYAFMVELDFLDGRKRLPSKEVFSLLNYDG